MPETPSDRRSIQERGGPLHPVPTRPVFVALILGMAMVALLVGFTSVSLLYRTARTERLRELEHDARILASMIEAVARFDQQYSAATRPGGSSEATMDQVLEGLGTGPRDPEKAQLVVGRRVAGDSIEILLHSPGGGLERATVVPRRGVLAEPMQRALQQLSGHGELLDFRGTRVLAGYAFVPTLQIGIVYKVDLAAMRAPFRRTAFWAGGAAVLVVALGALGFILLARRLERRTSEALAEREAWFSALFEQSPIAIGVSREGTILHANTAYARLFGLSRSSEIVGHSILEHIAPESREMVKTRIRDFPPERGRYDQVEILALRPDGTRFPYLATVGRVNLPDGDAFLGFFSDISDRVHALEALRESRARLSLIFDTTSDLLALLRVDADGGVTLEATNRAYREFIATSFPMAPPGFEGKELVEALVSFGIPSPVAEAELPRYRQVAEEQRAISYEVPIPTARGESTHLITLQPVVSPAGRSTHVLHTAHDITSRARVERDLRASLRERETLLREVHHRVKNNLQIVASLLYFQQRRAATPEAAAGFADSRNRLQAMLLVHENLYRSHSLSRVDFGDYVASLVSQLRSTLGALAEGVEFRVEVEPLVLPVETALPMGMALCELVTNIFKYAWPDGRRGRAEVEVRRADGTVSVVVQDDGVGMPAGFDPEGGGGFGWRLVRDLVSQVDGTISLDGAAAGTRVMMNFPMPADRASPPGLRAP